MTPFHHDTIFDYSHNQVTLMQLTNLDYPSSFTLARFRLTLRAGSAFRLPPYSGQTWRGCRRKRRGMGHPCSSRPSQTRVFSPVPRLPRSSPPGSRPQGRATRSPLPARTE
jgi:hypothetical protein